MLRCDRRDVINRCNKKGNTPLLHAALKASRGHIVVSQLLAFGADASVQNNAGNTPIHAYIDSEM